MHNWLRFVIYPKNVIYDFDCDLINNQVQNKTKIAVKISSRKGRI